MALASLARWFGKRANASCTDDAQCGVCGRFFATGKLVCALCIKCGAAIDVCDEHRIYPTCLRCGYAVPCAMCGVLVGEKCANTVVCVGCEVEMAVCDKDVAEPVCSGCASR